MKKLQFGKRAAAVVMAGALALSLAACGSSDDDAKAGDGEVLTRTLKVGVFPTFNGLNGYVAQEQGFFEDEGLKVELVQAGAPSAMMPQLLGNSMDFALMDLVTPLIAKSKGVPVVGVAPGASGKEYPAGEKGPVGLWVRADGDITSVKDLENATFAVPQIGSAVWMDVRTAVDNAGGDSSKIKFVEAQDQIGALLAGDVSASTSSEPRDSSLLGEKKLKRLDNYLTMDGGLAYSYMATKEFTGKNAATVDAFERAILKANAFITENPDKLPAIAASYIEQPIEALENAVYPTFLDQEISAEDIDAALTRMVKYGLIDEAKAPKASDFLRTKS